MGIAKQHNLRLRNKAYKHDSFIAILVISTSAKGAIIS